MMSPEDDLFPVWMMFGIKRARVYFRLLCGTREPVVLMLRERSKWQTHKDLSTDAEHRGGAMRSSDEGLVMGLEQRRCIDRY